MNNGKTLFIFLEIYWRMEMKVTLLSLLFGSFFQIIKTELRVSNLINKDKKEQRLKALTSPEVALCLYKSTMPQFMEHCCHTWAGAPSCYLES